MVPSRCHGFLTLDTANSAFASAFTSLREPRSKLNLHTISGALNICRNRPKLMAIGICLIPNLKSDSSGVARAKFVD